MKIQTHNRLIAILTLCIFFSTIPKSHAQEQISMQIDFSKKIGQMTPVWAWFGYDEPNYTYMKDGKKLLSELSALSSVPVYVRCHNLMTTGDGTAALKWGSSNIYTEDENGNPIYNWTIVDRIFDTYIERGIKPLAQLGFMPKALSINPEPYQHKWRPGIPYHEVFTGWAYPPKDYSKWSELVYQWVKHCVDRYGKDEVASWYWELWNEPNGNGYWRGTNKEYFKLYDYTVDAVKRALPESKIGGPHVTGPNGHEAAQFLREFLDHCSKGINYLSGKIGTDVNFIAFHAKGGPKVIDNYVQMNMGQQLRDISKGFEIVASYPEFKHLPIIIGESDPEGCAACSMKDYPENAYRNGTMYSSYTAASFARKYQLADHFGINFIGAVSWSFEFENQPWFNGFRDLATNGVNKPVLNVFRMFGLMSGQRVKVDGNLAYDYIKIRDHSIRGNHPDVNAIAAIDKKSATIMLWNYHDNDLVGPTALIDINLTNIPTNKAQLYHYRIDKENSNSYEIWKEMGSPQNPTETQIKKLEKTGQLQMLTSPEWLKINNGKTSILVELPSQGVSLIKLDW